MEGTVTNILTGEFKNLLGETSATLHFGSGTDGPIGVMQGTRIHLRPLIYELKVLTKERGLQRFGDIVNYAQDKMIEEAERQLYEYGQIRMVVLKARQMGLSTVIEAIIFVLSMLYRDFQSLIISHESESSEHILGMTKRYWTTYPFRRFHDEQYNGRKQLAWSDIGSNIVVATAKNMGAGRSKTLHALHASEVAFWDKPEELITGLRQAIPSIGLTAIFYESTANGIGNFFHTTWLDAESGRSEYVAMFFPWFLDPMYTAKNIPRREQDKFAALKDPDQEEKKLLGMGISTARLLWRRWAIINLCQNSLDKFKQEYPVSSSEAFLSTGRNVFNLNNLLSHYYPMQPKQGKLVRRGRDVKFEEDRPGLREDERGMLKVYRLPSSDRNWGVYQIGCDPTHTTVGDKACAQVFSRRTLEQCAVLSAHLDPIEFGKQLMLLGEWYNNGMLAIETTGPGYATMGWVMGAGYPFVYKQQSATKDPDKPAGDTHGWQTNQQTKHQAIAQLVNNLAQPLVKIGTTTYGLMIHDEETFIEMRDYITDEKGGFMNGNGTLFDDRVMAAGIGLATHFIEPPLEAYTRDDSHLTLVKDINTKVGEAMQQDQQTMTKVQEEAEWDRTPAWQLEIQEDDPA